MEKKQYIFPVVEIALLNTRELMKASGTSSDTPPDPGAQSGAPRRRTEVF